MNLDPRRAALWDAMGLGPLWRDRDAVVAEHEPDAAQAAAEPIPAEPAELNPAPARRIATLGWEELRADVAECRACGLCESRIQTVFAAGEPGARWVIVGEAPGADEDMRGEPFVGQAGKLLDAMLAALGLARGPEVAILNVLKCRPPANRNPEPAEVAACAPYLARQLELIAPDRILVLGRFAAQALLASGTSIAGLRGRLHSIEVGGRAVPVVVSYHPAYLLRNLADKARSWEDLLMAKRVGKGSDADLRG